MMNTCSCMSVTPISVVLTAPEAVFTNDTQPTLGRPIRCRGQFVGCGSEGLVVEVHQRRRGAGQDPAGGRELRQHVAREELGGGELALVERLILGADIGT